jgi:hypothetical protein
LDLQGVELIKLDFEKKDHKTPEHLKVTNSDLHASCSAALAHGPFILLTEVLGRLLAVTSQPSFKAGLHSSPAAVHLSVSA